MVMCDWNKGQTIMMHSLCEYLNYIKFHIEKCIDESASVMMLNGLKTISKYIALSKGFRHQN